MKSGAIDAELLTADSIGHKLYAKVIHGVRANKKLLFISYSTTRCHFFTSSSQRKETKDGLLAQQEKNVHSFRRHIFNVGFHMTVLQY